MFAMDPAMTKEFNPSLNRRQALIAGASLSLAAAVPALATQRKTTTNIPQGASIMAEEFITTKDGVEIFFKDWGPRDAQVIVFHHGWPLSADDWDTQMLYFLNKGYRVVAHDRRGHGRSSQVSGGHDILICAMRSTLVIPPAAVKLHDMSPDMGSHKVVSRRQSWLAQSRL
jgi:non-heme chloroperoxidase